ncbi:hypothetical protein FRC04_010584 [Tulasnella sp. 424]|nr:hypothetical protein FRC04_010584 [Tulasnella sp. 424]KAG8972319.1 hypothetical protein FRC05_010161 [Tulasnella sp. 425]
MAYQPPPGGIPPYYSYYNPQQLYYPYAYSYPYGHPGMAYMQPPPIDPSLLSGNPNAQQQTSTSTAQNQLVPQQASPTASEASDRGDLDDETDDDHPRFALHPVPQPPKAPKSASSKKSKSASEPASDIGFGEEVDDGDPNVPGSSKPRKTTGGKTPKTNYVSSNGTPRVRVPGPIGPVTGAPTDEQSGDMDASEFVSPVRALNHIDLDLFPSKAVFENILYTYQSNLSARKRNKALISRRAYAEIQKTLVEIRDARCRRGTAQYRFWVKKMFGLIDFYGHDVVGHQGKPVAIREDIYDILVHCHDQCDHGGRDRTVEVVKDFYRWIPKVIIGEFVKHCPGCNLKRATVKSEASKMPLYDLADIDAMEPMEPDEDDEMGAAADGGKGPDDDDDDDVD